MSMHTYANKGSPSFKGWYTRDELVRSSASWVGHPGHTYTYTNTEVFFGETGALSPFAVTIDNTLNLLSKRRPIFFK